LIVALGIVASADVMAPSTPAVPLQVAAAAAATGLLVWVGVHGR
jgi:hypothetical protein